ncbi:MAG: sterol desaturase family protein [Deltaproteobacteria bacterium]|nr:sterol desaturase family protein [Deltaproteobacteria bacterium]
MRNEFRYTSKTPLNELSYALLIAAAVALIQAFGEPLRHALAVRFTLAEVFVGLGFALYMTVFWLAGGFYLLCDRFGWLQRYRVQRRPDGTVRDRSPGRLRHTVRVVLQNQLLGTLPVLGGVYFLMRWRGMSLDAPTPGALEMLLHLALIVLVEEVLFYAVHVAMHTKPLMKRFHRIHHEYKEPIGITTHYVHPVEHLFGNLMPIFAGPLLVGAHLYTTLIWVVVAVINAIHTHSNYDFPWMSWSVDHDFHHYNVRGNYGALGLMDRVFGTWLVDGQAARPDPAPETAPAAEAALKAGR